MPHRRPGEVVALLALVLLPVRADAEDVVVARSPGNAASRVRLTGEVLEYTGRELQLRLASGTVTKIAGERVVSVETRRLPDHEAAEQRYARGEMGPATTLYLNAARAETRTWVRRAVLAQVVRCYQASSQPGPAGQAFLALTASDPATPDFACIPLLWARGEEAAGESLAREWLSDAERPVARLLGASHLLGSARREAAVAALQELAAAADARVAWLAQAQLWRATAASGAAADVERWRAALEKIPENLRGGPSLVVGEALALRKDSTRAALAFLRAPLSHSQERRLAALGLLGAGEQLEKLSDSGGAARLYRELIDRYPESPAAAEAGERLRELQPAAK